MHYIILLIGLFLSLPGFATSILCPENRCVAVIDAGNSGSSLNIYSYEEDASHTPFKIKNVFSKKIVPGFASIKLTQKSINQYLSLLFSDVPDFHIPVYFYATAGMRMLDFSRQQTYYDKLTQWFSNQSQWKLVIAKTLKSKEEALYGWLAVNYELGTLNSPTTPLVGVVDTGSASVQIAFPVKNINNLNPDDYTNINVYGRQVTLFTHGFLGLGQDEIRSQYLDNRNCFTKGYPLPNDSLAAGDFELCTTLLKPLVNQIHQVDSALKSAIQNNPKQIWYIIGGISAMLQERPFAFDHNEFTNQELAEKANRQVCQQEWAVLSTLYPKNIYLFANCLSASYFYSLFVDGFGIDRTEPIHYISKTISANNWTLGVVLNLEKQLGV